MTLNWSNIFDSVLAGIILGLITAITVIISNLILNFLTLKSSYPNKKIQGFLRIFWNLLLIIAIFLSPSKIDDAQAIRKVIEAGSALASANVVTTATSRSKTQNSTRRTSSPPPHQGSNTGVRFIPSADEIAQKLSKLTGSKQYYAKEFKIMERWDKSYVVRMDYNRKEELEATPESLEGWHPDDGPYGAYTYCTNTYIKLTVYRGNSVLGSQSFNEIAERVWFTPQEVVDFLWALID